jgi:hypothetical protein
MPLGQSGDDSTGLSPKFSVPRAYTTTGMPRTHKNNTTYLALHISYPPKSGIDYNSEYPLRQKDIVRLLIKKYACVIMVFL